MTPAAAARSLLVSEQVGERVAYSVLYFVISSCGTMATKMWDSVVNQAAKMYQKSMRRKLGTFGKSVGPVRRATVLSCLFCSQSLSRGGKGSIPGRDKSYRFIRRMDGLMERD